MKRSLQNILETAFRSFLKFVRSFRFGKALFDKAISDALRTDLRYHGKNWQTTDELYALTKRQLVNNEYWIPGVLRTFAVANKYYSYVADKVRLDDATVLDLGCGVFNPFGVASIFALNGAHKVTCLDVSGFDITRVSEVTFEMLSHAKLFPEDIAFDPSTVRIVSSKLSAVDFRKLKMGDLACLSPLNINHVVADISNLTPDITGSQYNVIFSHTVLEHFLNPEQCIRSLAALSSPSAVHYHYIDFCDHRAYTHPDKFHYWSYLMEPKHVKDTLINKLRPSQYRRLLEQCGFEILLWDLEFEPTPAHVLANIHNDWRLHSIDDLRATRVNCICKPAPRTIHPAG